MPEIVKIALVGVGGYGAHYTTALLGNEEKYGVSIVGAVDPAIEKAGTYETLCAKGVPCLTSLDDFFEAGLQADLTVLSTPIQTHAPLSTAAMRHGSHVLCEKPVAATIQEARAMQAAEEETSRFLAIGYQWSYSDAIQSVKADMMAGVFGKPRRFKTLCCWPRPASYYGRAAWAGSLKSATGDWILDSPVNNATAHYLHNMLFLLGDELATAALPASVQAELYRANPITNYDTAGLRCLTTKGVEVLFYTTHAVPSNYGPVAVFEFEDAVVANDGGYAQESFTAFFNDGRVKRYDIPDTTNCNKLWQCVEAIRLGKRPVCTVGTGSSHLLCVNGAQESVAEITEFPQPLINVEARGDDDSLIWVNGLQGTMTACFGAGLLPSELPSVDWAKPGKVVNLAGYDRFPSL